MLIHEKSTLSYKFNPGKHLDIKKLSLAGVIVTLGIVFGDLGTSPLYKMKAIVIADEF
jgi:K+ transporter